MVTSGTPEMDRDCRAGRSGPCGIYAPIRNWNYDAGFQDVARLPPLTPRFVAVEQILFNENFR